MARFQVTTSEMKAAIIELSEKNEMFKSKVRELEVAQQALHAQWQGDANVAFNTAFENDKEKWMEFSYLIDRYIQALASIMQAYEKAEQTNISNIGGFDLVDGGVLPGSDIILGPGGRLDKDQLLRDAIRNIGDAFKNYKVKK